MATVDVPIVVRGSLIEGDWTDFGGRSAGVEFRAPDPRLHVDALPLATPMAMADLYDVSFADIVDYLHELGPRLDPETNPFIQQAYEIGLQTSGLTPSVLRQNFRALPVWFDRAFVREMVECTIGIEHLEGWVEQKLIDGRRQRIRAFGSRARAG